MRMFSLIPILAAAGACEQRQLVDCTKIDLPSVESCFQKHRSDSEPASLKACLPFSEPLATSGIWVVGFEKNDFFEGWGQRIPPANILWEESTGASLSVDSKVLETAVPAEPHIHALQVDVVGRRALCPVGGLNAYPIAVEKLTVRRRIAQR